MLAPVVKKATAFPAWVWSTLSMIAATAAGVLFYVGTDINYVALGAVFVFINGFLDSLDGEVARARGEEGPAGDFVDHVIDRYADVVILAGIGLGPLCASEIGLLALAGVLLTSYMGTQAQAVGAGRHYGGVLGRADRIALMVGASFLWVAMAYSATPDFVIFGRNTNVIELMMVWFAVAGNLTAIWRSVSTYLELSRDSRSEDE